MPACPFKLCRVILFFNYATALVPQPHACRRLEKPSHVVEKVETILNSLSVPSLSNFWREHESTSKGQFTFSHLHQVVSGHVNSFVLLIQVFGKPKSISQEKKRKEIKKSQKRINLNLFKKYGNPLITMAGCSDLFGFPWGGHRWPPCWGPLLYIIHRPCCFYWKYFLMNK